MFVSKPRQVDAFFVSKPRQIPLVLFQNIGNRAYSYLKTQALECRPLEPKTEILEAYPEMLHSFFIPIE